MLKSIKENLPGFNCGNCGYDSCDSFARALITKKEKLSGCPVLSRFDYLANKKALEALLNHAPGFGVSEEKPIVGVIDKYKADIILKPLKDENSCREVLLPFSGAELRVEDIIRYRPMGCPITHVAKIIEKSHQLITVHLIGPCKIRAHEDDAIKDVGLCMVIAFRGRYEGKNIKVGETVRFLPHHCMMQKVHSGIVVNIENQDVLIEAIDLKVWGMPEQVTEETF